MNPGLQENRPPLWRLVWESIRQDRIPLRASALAFQTLTSLLPLLAITLALLSMPAFLSQRARILDRLAEVLVPEDLDLAMADGLDLARGAQGPDGEPVSARAQFQAKFHAAADQLAANLGTIGIFSFLVLIVVAGLLYHTIEETFNAIWKVSAGRPFFMKVAITTAFIFWGPLIVGLPPKDSSSLRYRNNMGIYIIYQYLSR